MKKFNCILLVDDDETSNFITEMIISKVAASTHTHSTKNGKEALTFIEENCDRQLSKYAIQCPDLIFLDINMPVMDGIEFLEEFYSNKKYTNDVNIYVLSSSENTEDIKKVSRYNNVKGYITKPMTADKLYNIVGK